MAEHFGLRYDGSRISARFKHGWQMQRAEDDHLVSLAYTLLLSVNLLGMTTITGQVTGQEERPVPAARVFAEPGIGGTLLETQASPEGRFTFKEVAPGEVGIFAIAPGFGFGGKHLNLAAGDEQVEVSIALYPAERISGRVSNSKGQPVAGARVTRIALLGPDKVGIPLAKLRSLGYPEPVTDDQGRFAIENLPAGETVALKVGHPDYAQEAVSNVATGARDVRITLYPGVLVFGEVVSRDGGLPVARTGVVIRNAQPPHDTAVAETDAAGSFVLRLKPGVYLYQAASVNYRSPGWERLTIPADVPDVRSRLVVAGTGYLRGVVKDAVSGAPIEGARLSILSSGMTAALIRTGPSGQFRVAVAEGENVVRLESAAGYYPPAAGTARASVKSGEEVELPGMWLKPLPKFRLQVVGENGQQPVAGAVVTLLRPAQFGWRVTDGGGWVEIAVGNLPPGRALVGRVEHPTKSLGALFALSLQDAQGARVQLMPWASVQGRVISDRDKGLEGALIGGVFPGEGTEDALLLWQCVAGKDGAFVWDTVAPGLPQCCVARTGEDTVGESVPFNPQPGASCALGNVVIPNGVASESLLGKPLRWYDNRLICGNLTDKKSLKSAPAWLVYCSDEEAPMVIEGLTVARAAVRLPDLTVAVVVDGTYACANAGLPILSGKAPAAATTYLLGAGGKVVLETFGMPPLRALRALRP